MCVVADGGIVDVGVVSVVRCCVVGLHAVAVPDHFDLAICCSAALVSKEMWAAWVLQCRNFAALSAVPWWII